MDQTLKSKLDDLVNEFLCADKERAKELVAAILELVQGPVYSFFLAMDIPRTQAPDVAGKLYQDLFDKKIWKYKPRPESSFWSWLCAVIVHTATDWHRAHARYADTEAPDPGVASDAQSVRDWAARAAASGEVEFGDAHAHLVGRRIPAPSPERLALLGVFEEAFGKLSGPEQDLMRLKEVEGLEYGPIAEILHPGHSSEEHLRLISLLKTRHHRAKAKVREAMEADHRVPRSFFESKLKGDELNGKSVQSRGRRLRTGS
jgi:DNA-directed RNA polymerase specialized sigma24 family protein